MDFNEYQKESKKTAVYPTLGEKFVYPTLGLIGESGEVAEKVKKIFRDKEGQVDDETKKMIEKELGDVLWYLAQLATDFDLSFDDVAKNNIKKLSSRMKRGKLLGDGDDR